MAYGETCRGNFLRRSFPYNPIKTSVHLERPPLVGGLSKCIKFLGGGAGESLLSRRSPLRTFLQTMISSDDYVRLRMVLRSSMRARRAAAVRI